MSQSSKHRANKIVEMSTPPTRRLTYFKETAFVQFMRKIIPKQPDTYTIQETDKKSPGIANSTGGPTGSLWKTKIAHLPRAKSTAPSTNKRAIDYSPVSNIPPPKFVRKYNGKNKMMNMVTPKFSQTINIGNHIHTHGLFSPESMGTLLSSSDELFSREPQTDPRAPRVPIQPFAPISPTAELDPNLMLDDYFTFHGESPGSSGKLSYTPESSQKFGGGSSAGFNQTQYSSSLSFGGHNSYRPILQIEMSEIIEEHAKILETLKLFNVLEIDLDLNLEQIQDYDEENKLMSKPRDTSYGKLATKAKTINLTKKEKSLYYEYQTMLAEIMDSHKENQIIGTEDVSHFIKTFLGCQRHFIRLLLQEGHTNEAFFVEREGKIVTVFLNRLITCFERQVRVARLQFEKQVKTRTHQYVLEVQDLQEKIEAIQKINEEKMESLKNSYQQEILENDSLSRQLEEMIKKYYRLTDKPQAVLTDIEGWLQQMGSLLNAADENIVTELDAVKKLNDLFLVGRFTKNSTRKDQEVQTEINLGAAHGVLLTTEQMQYFSKYPYVEQFLKYINPDIMQKFDGQGNLTRMDFQDRLTDILAQKSENDLERLDTNKLPQPIDQIILDHHLKLFNDKSQFINELSKFLRNLTSYGPIYIKPKQEEDNLAHKTTQIIRGGGLERDFKLQLFLFLFTVEKHFDDKTISSFFLKFYNEIKLQNKLEIHTEEEIPKVLSFRSAFRICKKLFQKTPTYFRKLIDIIICLILSEVNIPDRLLLGDDFELCKAHYKKIRIKLSGELDKVNESIRKSMISRIGAKVENTRNEGGGMKNIVENAQFGRNAGKKRNEKSDSGSKLQLSIIKIIPELEFNKFFLKFLKLIREKFFFGEQEELGKRIKKCFNSSDILGKKGIITRREFTIMVDKFFTGMFSELECKSMLAYLDITCQDQIKFEAFIDYMNLNKYPDTSTVLITRQVLFQAVNILISDIHKENIDIVYSTLKKFDNIKNLTHKLHDYSQFMSMLRIINPHLKFQRRDNIFLECCNPEFYIQTQNANTTNSSTPSAILGIDVQKVKSLLLRRKVIPRFAEKLRLMENIRGENALDIGSLEGGLGRRGVVYGVKPLYEESKEGGVDNRNVATIKFVEATTSRRNSRGGSRPIIAS